ncbi:helix-turn-helix transcriptional regulator [Anaerocolumna sp. AGMB13020]|uniref:helix-turn-helix transcriptional regulator n=1 Tax=Anaerocolumna sp. AGMB13020 TaxID=3081750 RepID=UPI002953620E|nr:helix-turn-helix transcriptional regulator [Anaerocolumna sp. AGMB13020]WOO39089.1 helix-turn-helix transcriptional regulator [Anaerocolumna sp. AGMB13020]
MPINMVIRENRKAHGLTQEQIAEYLGVSTPAVNKWEKGVSYPDVSLLPALARLLKIDLNTLLCFEEGLTDQEINQFSNKVIDTIRKKDYESGFSFAMEKIREYPNCDKLLYTAALLLEGALFMYGFNADNKEVYQKQITALYERVAGSKEEQVRNSAVYMLVSKYMEQEEYDKSQEMLDLLPESADLDKMLLQANLYRHQNKLEEAAEILERKLLMEVNEIHGILMNLIDIALKMENLRTADHLAELSVNLSDRFDLWGVNAYLIPLEVALAKKNVKDCLSLIKSVLSAVASPWKVSDSLLYSHIPVKEETQQNYCKQLFSAFLAEMESSPKYEFLHDNVEFRHLIERNKGKYN